MSIRIIYDATHILQLGASPPVGITRVEHYVVEYLLANAVNPVIFVCFDKDLDRYRQTTGVEAAWIRWHTLHRYDASEAGPITNEPTAARVARKLRKYAAQDTREFAAGLSFLLDSRLAVPGRYPATFRILLRIVRAAAYRTLLIIHRAIRILFRIRHWIYGLRSGGGRLSKEGEFEWQQSDSLVVLANLWDYMNYDYFDTLVTIYGLTVTGVVYDVIALVYPYTTREPIDLYYRHWVAIGRACSHIVAISHYTAETYEKYILTPNSLTATVSVSFLPNFLKDRVSDIGVRPIVGLIGKNFVVYCSTIESRKNHETLMHVWERLIDDIEPDCLPILVFVGRWGWGFENVQRMYERCYRLRPKLQILEDVADDQLIWLYKNAMFTVFPSLSEGFGLAAAESLSFGTPVITSNCPALQEATEGLMPRIDPLDVPEWARQICELLHDKKLLASLRLKAADFCGADYDEFACNILRSALSGHVVTSRR